MLFLLDSVFHSFYFLLFNPISSASLDPVSAALPENGTFWRDGEPRCPPEYRPKPFVFIEYPTVHCEGHKPVSSKERNLATVAIRRKEGETARRSVLVKALDVHLNKSMSASLASIHPYLKPLRVVGPTSPGLMFRQPTFTFVGRKVKVSFPCAQVPVDQKRTTASFMKKAPIVVPRSLTAGIHRDYCIVAVCSCLCSYFLPPLSC